jgi:hypothetical protein
MCLLQEKSDISAIICHVRENSEMLSELSSRAMLPSLDRLHGLPCICHLDLFQVIQSDVVC